ncbi:MAG: MBL fold metallo-hydrolase [Bacteroidales bacterium]|nr:MBL fold metallo-hydrolase [Bacteroidales bacterium]
MKRFISFTFIASVISLFSCSSSKPIDMDVTEFSLLLKENEAALIDVRTPLEYDEGHIAGAVNIDWNGDSFVETVKAEYPLDKPLALYCRSGRRSAAAAKKLVSEGYTVYNLKGGYLAWCEKGLRTTKYEVELFRTANGSLVSLCLIKHGSVEIEYDGVSIQVDPVPGFGKETDYAKEFLKADVILVTHSHPDHLSGVAIEALTGEKTLLVLNKKSDEMIEKGELMGKGGPVAKRQVIANGEKMELPKGITLEAVPAYNTTPGREMFHPVGEGNGYILTIDGFKIYIAGDTEDVPEMANLAAMGIDVALLPVNQPYTMTPEQCANATKMIAPKVLIPYHFGQTDLSGLQEMLPEQKILFRKMN